MGAGRPPHCEGHAGRRRKVWRFPVSEGTAQGPPAQCRPTNRMGARMLTGMDGSMLCRFPADESEPGWTSAEPWCSSVGLL
eukprot:3907862-Alexandrium_andersonii.AAC.1